MLKKLMILLGSMVILLVVGAIIISLTNPKSVMIVTEDEEPIQVVTTFYPVYLIGLNLVDQIEGIEVKSLTDLNTGCLHDYQLTTEDMIAISKADVLIINGGGMEGFLEDIIANYPNLIIIDASTGISMLKYNADNSDNSTESPVTDLLSHDEDDSLGIYNPHVWLNPTLYMKQIENVSNELLNYIEMKSSLSTSDVTILTNKIEQNAQIYLEEIKELDISYEDELASITSEAGQLEKEPQAVIFHDSFFYLADRVGLKVSFAVPLDSDTALSAGDIADIIDAVKRDDIKYLFTEQQFSDSIAKQIEAETDAKVYIIDSVVTGNGAKASYITAMQRNLVVLQEALQ